MHPGYFLEEELLFYYECYRRCNDVIPGDGQLKQEYEGNASKMEENGDLISKRRITDTLTEAMLINLRAAIGDYARYDCQGCRIDHPSQKYHDICLWTKPKEWINHYGYHEHALRSLNIYEVMKDWNDQLNQAAKHKEEHKLANLTDDEMVEAYKSWMFLKENQLIYGRQRTNKEWQDFWKQKLLDSYEQR